MTDTTFDTAAHPRSTTSGRFVESTHSAPEATLATSAGDLRAEALAAVEAVTHGRDTLDAAIGSGRFGFTEMNEARELVWEGAGGPPARLKLEGHLNAVNVPLTSDSVERILEVTYYRAKSGRYSRELYEDLTYLPVDKDELRGADYQAESRGNYVTNQWEDGQVVGPEAEITDDAARLFAEDAIANLRQNITIVNLPRLAEFANQPFSEAGGASPEKVDAFHDELAAVRASHDYLSPRERVRLDMLATYALNALPGQN